MTIRLLRLGRRVYDKYKRIKGAKIHAVVSFESLPLSVQIGPSDENDPKRPIKLLKT